MLQYERFETIMQMLNTGSSVRVTDLSRALGVSESTIRRDINDLAAAGRLRKVFGGAVPLDNGEAPADGTPAFAGLPPKHMVNTRSLDLETKETIQADEKQEVAAKAAELIEEGDLVYIDAGTTTGSMIDQITCTGAVFVTNGIRHALRLADRGLKSYLLSGRVKASTEAVIGHEAVDSLGRWHFTKSFIGTDGIDRECGLTTADIDESMVKTEAIRRSKEVFVLADGSKFGLVASVTFAPLDAGTVITDHLPDPGYREQLKLVEIHK